MERNATTQEAIQSLTDGHLSKYRISQWLNVGPIMVSRYALGLSRMGPITAARCKEVFGIVITDVRRPGRPQTK